jgi:hypothetical protein
MQLAFASCQTSWQGGLKKELITPRASSHGVLAPPYRDGLYRAGVMHREKSLHSSNQ